MMSLLSVIIANYNYGRFLEDAIRSVLTQGAGDQVELIICDGGSTDNSVEVIKKYSDKIAWWVSEKDGGQSAAFNKGFAHAHGEFLTWLNSDDLLLPGSLARFFEYVKEYPNVDWFVADTVFMDLDGRVRTIGITPPKWASKILYTPTWVTITAPSTIFKRSLLTKVGGIDESLHYVMDTDLWIKFSKAHARVGYINAYFWGFRVHEESKTSASITENRRQPRFLKERILIRQRQGITALYNRWAYFSKRVGCLMSGRYLTRLLFKKKYTGCLVSEVFHP